MTRRRISFNELSRPARSSSPLHPFGAPRQNRSLVEHRPGGRTATRPRRRRRRSARCSSSPPGAREERDVVDGRPRRWRRRRRPPTRSARPSCRRARPPGRASRPGRYRRRTPPRCFTNGAPFIANVLLVDYVDARPRAGGEAVPARAGVRGCLVRLTVALRLGPGPAACPSSASGPSPRRTPRGPDAAVGCEEDHRLLARAQRRAVDDAGPAVVATSDATTAASSRRDGLPTACAFLDSLRCVIWGSVGRVRAAPSKGRPCRRTLPSTVGLPSPMEQTWGSYFVAASGVMN